MQKNWTRAPLKVALGFVGIAVVVGAILVSGFASAHTDPSGCVASGVSLSIATFRADGTTPVGAGTVAVGETIKYQATLSHAGGLNCNYDAGDLDIITPDGVNHDVDGGVIPLISSTTPFSSLQVSYVVSADDIDGDSDVDASAVYTGGSSHLGENNVSPVGATAPAASVVSGRIVVDKVTTPTSEQDFEFDPSWGSNFFLDDTDTPTSSGERAPGAYSVLEVNIPAGWVQGSTTCVSSLQDTENAGSLELDAGEVITCTFHNAEQTGQIIIDKVSLPSSEQDFEFDPSWGSNFFLDDTDTPVNSGPLASGTYSVSEVNIPAGWDFASSTCSDGSPITAIALAGGETVTCTFTNEQENGHIIVIKQTTPDGDAQSFEFDPSWGANFNLTDGGQHDSGELVVGSYSVAEVNVPTDWVQGTTTCVSSLGGTETPANLALDAGETITCTFTNVYVPPPVAEYCSPGYWKQEQHFDSWVDYQPTDLFSAVFGENVSILWSAKGKPAPVANPTLLQALEANGGGLNSLVRAAVGALLNASALETAMSPAEVISAFQAVYPGSATEYEALKADYTTEENCPLH